MSEFCKGDVRTSARGEAIFERIVSCGSLVLRQVTGTRAGEVGAQRFFASPYVTTEGLVETFAARAREACGGRRVVVAQDTTEVNFSGRGARRRGLGPAGDGRAPGFFIHASVAIDADEEAVLGLAGAQIWTREAGKVSPRHGRAADEKESARWLAGSVATGELLTGHAREVISVCDREGDIWNHLAHTPEGVELVIRARHNRPIEDGEPLFETLAATPVLATSQVVVAPRGPGDKGRVAQVTLRSRTVHLRRPAKAPRKDPKLVEIGIVTVVEEAPPPGVKPLLWRLATTLPVATAEQANDVVRLYRLRWRIEQVFRALKSDGLRIEETQVQEAQRLFRLSAMALGAAVRTIQLVDARDASSQPMSDVLDASLVAEVAILVRDREGATLRQKNPHPEGSLSWLAWVVARYGGWNCYGKPPGPKTMANGWLRFSATLAGVVIARTNADV